MAEKYAANIVTNVLSIDAGKQALDRQVRIHTSEPVANDSIKLL